MKAAACAKHFAVHSGPEVLRHEFDAEVSEKDLRETYLPAFQACVQEGHVEAVMGAYNCVNGEPCCGSKTLLKKILREEWGFDGAVVTDWGDMDIVVDGADAVAAGNDIVMPGGPPVIRQILKGYEEGRVTREEMETAAGHLLCMIRRIHGKEK